MNLLDGIDPVLLHAMLQPPPLRSNLRVAEKVDEGIMPSQKKLKRKSEGDGRPDENEKLTRTDAPMPGTSSSSVTTDVSHPTYGQVSYILYYYIKIHLIVKDEFNRLNSLMHCSYLTTSWSMIIEFFFWIGCVKSRWIPKSILTLNCDHNYYKKWKMPILGKMMLIKSLLFIIPRNL